MKATAENMKDFATLCLYTAFGPSVDPVVRILERHLEVPLRLMRDLPRKQEDPVAIDGGGHALQDQRGTCRRQAMQLQGPGEHAVDRELQCEGRALVLADRGRRHCCTRLGRCSGGDQTLSRAAKRLQMQKLGLVNAIKTDYR